MASGRIPASPEGPGHFRDPVQPDREPPRPFGPQDDGYWAGVLGSPAARLGIPRPTQAIDSTSVSHVLYAKSWESLKSTAMAMLGGASFDLGVAYGVGEGAWGVIDGLLEFLQMIVLNGLYNKVQRGSASWNPMVRAEWGGVDYLLHGPMETAHRQFGQLMEELRLVVAH